MTLDNITDVEQLKKINKALMSRVESAMDQHGNAFSLFQTAISLEGQVKRRTDELTVALRQFEKTNIELEAAKEASEIANLSKTRFLAAASHDVLQPLNAALLSISVLHDLQKSDIGKELAQQIERSLDTMSELLSTLMDISKLDAGIVKPKFEDFPLSQILDAIKSDFLPIAHEKNLELRFRCDDTIAIRSDRTMLRRIFQNLVSNALRYTEKGGVLIGIKKRKNKLHVQVIDTGFGIPADKQAYVFDEFHRGALPSGHDRTANSGLGLGLSIVKRMATTLDHELKMVSRENRGTKFSVVIPRAGTINNKKQGISETLIPHKGFNFANKRILLIENDPAGINAMMLLLESWNCETALASNIQETISKLSDTAWVPDLILADQHLDDGDLGTIAIQSARDYLNQEIPALIITADPTKVILKSVKQMGIELMHKPIKPAQLRALMNHIFNE